MTSEMFDPKKIMENLVIPEDVTLEVAAGYIIHHELSGQMLDAAKREYAAELAKAKRKDLSIEVKYRRADESECPLDMTMGEFRALVPPGRIQITISNGGIKSRPKVPELV